MVDEYSRWCYREIHAERSDYASATFLRNAIQTAPFKIKEVQTDNGHEFTNAIFGQKRLDHTRQKIAVYNAWSNTRIKTCLNFRSPIHIIALAVLHFFHASLTP